MNHSELSIMDLRNLIDHSSEYRCCSASAGQCPFSGVDYYAGRRQNFASTGNHCEYAPGIHA